jgi:hypothetical protein
VSDIQRWDKDFQIPDPDGEYVTYADHVAAVAAARAEGARDCQATHTVRGLKEITRIAAKGYAEGQRDERDRITKAVEALPKAEYDGHAFGDLTSDSILAAIKGDSE